MAVAYSRYIVGNLPWYSVLIVTGIALAVWLASREEQRLGLPKDTMVDLALTAVPLGMVGARLYYVLMSWELFADDPIRILYIWEGGIAIYGAVLGGLLGVLWYARKKKLRCAMLTDIIVPGLLLAQAIGRWGNYFNMEAYGVQITDPKLQFFPAAVLIPSAEGYTWYAATFFYESVWNLLGFGALWKLRGKAKETGDMTLWYMLIYGAGRFVIEQLRMDSLYLGPLRVSQYVSLLICAIAAAVIVIRLCRKNGKAHALAGISCALWLLRWFVLENIALYALCMIAAAAVAFVLVRNNRKAVWWMSLALTADVLGIALTMLNLPTAEAGAFLHALLCSAALPLGVYALYTEN